MDRLHPPKIEWKNKLPKKITIHRKIAFKFFTKGNETILALPTEYTLGFFFNRLGEYTANYTTCF